MQAEWERCLNYLRGMLSDTVYKTYFAQTKLTSLTTGHAVVSVPPGLDTAVYSAYKELIKLGWKEATHNDTPMEFEFQPQEVVMQAAPPIDNNFKDFLKPSVPLSNSFRFENFVPGDKAQLAFNAALAVRASARRTCCRPSATTCSKKIPPSACATSPAKIFRSST